MKRLLPIAASAALLVGCTSAPTSDKPKVLASFYPLQYLVEKIAGDHVEVTSLTPKGAEPHDLELAPAQVAQIGKADALIYLSGFQPSVDAAVREAKPSHALDVAQFADLQPLGGDEHDHDHAADHDHTGDDGHNHDHDHAADHDHPAADGHDHTHDHDHAADHDHTGDEGHKHGGLDPHFWLDPARMATVAPQVAATLSSADPSHAEDYKANAAALVTQLTELKESFTAGLSSCKNDTIIVTHEAYGYLLAGTKIHQVGMSGIDPEADPAPATLAKINKLMADTRVTTVFTENLINPKAAETFAAEIGAKTAVLDPLENQANASADYVTVMKENLAALRTALQCQ